MSLNLSFPNEPIKVRQRPAFARPTPAFPPHLAYERFDRAPARPDGLGSPELSEILSLVYDCAASPCCWPDALAAICGALGFVSGSLLLPPAGARPARTLASHGVEPDWALKLSACGLDLRAAFARELCDDGDGSPDRACGFQIANSATGRFCRFHREWAAPQGLIETFVIAFAADADTCGIAVFGRHRSAGPASDAGLKSLRLVAPHIRRCLSIGILTERTAAYSQALAATFDGLRAKIVLVDETLRLVFANTAAKTMLGDDQLFRLTGGRLRLADQAATAELAEAVMTVSRARHRERASFNITAVSSGGARTLVHVLPLDQAGQSQQTAVALLIAPETARLPGEAMAMLYDLTPKETRLFELVADGKSPAGIAAELGIAPSTVKTHMLHVFAKTGVNRQADLVRLAASLTVAV